MDYKLLLKKYMQEIINIEGVSFLTCSLFVKENFSESQLTALALIEDELRDEFNRKD